MGQAETPHTQGEPRPLRAQDHQEGQWLVEPPTLREESR